MIQIEQENISKQLKEALEQKTLFEKIDSSIISTKIIKGSLVKTNRGYLFLSIAFGKLLVDEQSIIAISPNSPLGLKLMGLTKTDTVEINGIHYTVEEIL